MYDISDALKELKKGNFVLVHDSENREDEVDMVIAAQKVTSEHVSRMRMDAGGLICATIDKELAEKLDLPFLSEILDEAGEKFPMLEYLKSGRLQYDKRSAFSVSINHRRTYTGITDSDRALTISELGKFFAEADLSVNKYKLQKDFGTRFRSEGHVPLLISSGLESRQGHTELATELVRMTDLAPVSSVCEMLDGKTYKALSLEKATEYAKKNGLVILETKEIIERWQK